MIPTWSVTISLPSQDSYSTTSGYHILYRSCTICTHFLSVSAYLSALKEDTSPHLIPAISVGLYPSEGSPAIHWKYSHFLPYPSTLPLFSLRHSFPNPSINVGSCILS